jgi:extradiol dioxygenase family protein
VGAAGNGGRMQIVPYCHDDEWHHIAMVLEEADAPNFHRDFKVYLDGAPQETSYVLHMFDFDTGNAMDVRIGIGL